MKSQYLFVLFTSFFTFSAGAAPASIDLRPKKKVATKAKQVAKVSPSAKPLKADKGEIEISFPSGEGKTRVYAPTGQISPNALGEQWMTAIRSNDIGRMKSLIHPRCPIQSDEMLNRMVAGPVPSDFEIEIVDLGKDEQDVLKKIYAVTPEKQLNLKFGAKDLKERNKFGLGKGLPISRSDGKWFFVGCSKAFARASVK